MPHSPNIADRNLPNLDSARRNEAGKFSRVVAAGIVVINQDRQGFDISGNRGGERWQP